MTEALVQVDTLVKRFADTGPPAIDHLTTSIKAGQVTGLVGPDGAGKTTLMRLMAALLMPDARAASRSAASTSLNEAHGDPRHRSATCRSASGSTRISRVSENLDLYADLRGVVGEERAARPSTAARLHRPCPLHEPARGRALGRHEAEARPCLRDASLARAAAARRAQRRRRPDLAARVVANGLRPHRAGRRCRVEHGLSGRGRELRRGHRAQRGKRPVPRRPKAMTARMAGPRVPAARRRGGAPRSVLARRIDCRPTSFDGVMQGEAIRLVLQKGQRMQPDLASERGIAWNHPSCQSRPRFRRCVRRLLGGQPKRDAQPAPRGQAVATTRVQNAVQARGLTRRFGSFTAADHISFEIARGEIFGLLGPNGAGKSTTFKMMCGLLRPTEGAALVAGLDLYKARSAARARLGYMAQKFSLYGDLSVAPEPRLLRRRLRPAAARAARDAIARVVEAFDLRRRI